MVEYLTDEELRRFRPANPHVKNSRIIRRIHTTFFGYSVSCTASDMEKCKGDCYDPELYFKPKFKF